MRRTSVVLMVLCIGWGAALIHAFQAGASAPAAAPRPLVPAAANSIAASPEAFYGQVVTITASVDRILSPTSFTVDQNPKKNADSDVLVIVQSLSAPPILNAHVTVIGEVIRHDGRPAIRATTVLTSAGIDLAKRTLPPMTPEEEALDKTMKAIGPAFNAIRQAVAAPGGENVVPHATTLVKGFGTTETFWKTRGVADAQKWAADALAQSDALETAVAAGKWEDAKAALGALQQTCSACHAAYRERLDDGSYRIRSEGK